MPASSARSVALAPRLAVRTEANVAKASTSVPPAVANDEIVVQFAIGVDPTKRMAYRLTMVPPVLVTFRAGDAGPWQVERLDAVAGDALPAAARLDVLPDGASAGSPPAWALRGFTSNERYVARPERVALSAVQQPLGRPLATCAALIPIRKSEAWWELPQDERRAVLEEQSHHIAVGLEYLPAVARRLHHCRDLGEPFDFLTWFEFAPEANKAFDELLSRLRETPEWAYVDREVDIRLTRAT